MELIKKFTDEELKDLFCDILKPETNTTDDFKQIECKLKALNPWLEQEEDSQYNSLSTKDTELIRFLENCPKIIFEDYEQAFDGNLISPKVLILGINPKYEIDHALYGLETFYQNPFDSKRVPLHKNADHLPSQSKFTIELTNGEKKELANDDYYYGKNKFFYLRDDENNSEYAEIYHKHRQQIFDKNCETPHAIMEFFPYASCSETEWIKGVPMHQEIEQYMNLEKLLYSQQWLFCVIALILKRNPNVTVFLRKNNEKVRSIFREFFDAFPDVKVLSKINGQSNNLSLGNSKLFLNKSQLVKFLSSKVKNNVRQNLGNKDSKALDKLFEKLSKKDKNSLVLTNRDEFKNYENIDFFKEIWEIH